MTVTVVIECDGIREEVSQQVADIGTLPDLLQNMGEEFLYSATCGHNSNSNNWDDEED